MSGAQIIRPARNSCGSADARVCRAFWGWGRRQSLRHGRLPNDDNDHDHKISADLDIHRHLEGPRPPWHQQTSGSCLCSRTQRGGNDPGTGGSSIVRRRTFLGGLDPHDRTSRNEFDWNDSGPSSRCRFAGPTGTGHPTHCLWLLKQTPTNRGFWYPMAPVTPRVGSGFDGAPVNPDPPCRGQYSFDGRSASNSLSCSPGSPRSRRPVIGGSAWASRGCVSDSEGRSDRRRAASASTPKPDRRM